MLRLPLRFVPLSRAPVCLLGNGGYVRFRGLARRATDAEDALARRLLVDKYQPRYSGDLQEWGQIALPIAIDLSGQLADRVRRLS